MYRQGDILFIASVVPDGAAVRPDRVIAHGEVTGHSHRLTGNGDVVVDDAGQMFINAHGDVEVVHEEHKTILLPEGEYRVVRQREYDSKEIVRYVRD